MYSGRVGAGPTGPPSGPDKSHREFKKVGQNVLARAAKRSKVRRGLSWLQA